MAKNLGEYQTMTGAKGNVLSLNSWMQMILGGVVMIVSFATAQNLVGKLPNLPGIDKSIERPYSVPEPVKTVNTKTFI